MVSLRYQFATTFAAGLLARAALAQDANQILYPDVADLTFHYLDTVNVAYSTDYAEPWLYLWCWDQNNARQQIVYYSPSELTGKTSLAVQLTSNTEFTGSPCWFNLASAQIAGDEEVGVKSVEFNYVKEEGSKHLCKHYFCHICTIVNCNNDQIHL
ncbi:hypothetical protein GQ53DRAFT_757733 [Thozetella sp. PMI_491]|nr:hypothetical protein GQ53DRAFT_757733 [Thozetella sp. PMI_491]